MRTRNSCRGPNPSCARVSSVINTGKRSYSPISWIRVLSRCTSVRTAGRIKSIETSRGCSRRSCDEYMEPIVVRSGHDIEVLEVGQKASEFLECCLYDCGRISGNPDIIR